MIQRVTKTKRRRSQKPKEKPKEDISVPFRKVRKSKIQNQKSKLIKFKKYSTRPGPGHAFQSPSISTKASQNQSRRGIAGGFENALGLKDRSVGSQDQQFRKKKRK